MLKLEWTEDQSVKIPLFDKEHQILINLFNKMGEALLLEDAKREIEIVLDDLTKFAKIHFSHEEEAMLKYLYPGAVEHIREHEAFLDKIYKITHKYNELPASMHTKSDDYNLYLEVYSFLAGWFHTHIRKNDTKYSEYLLKAGIEKNN